MNLINGNSDLMIHTEKIGNNYIREVERKRKTYYADQVDDKPILKILTTIMGAIEPPRKQQATTTKSTKQETVEVSNNEDELF